MNRRQLIKAVIGTAAATTVPSMPFEWREMTLSEIILKTLRERQGELVANIERSNALLTALKAGHMLERA